MLREIRGIKGYKGTLWDKKEEKEVNLLYSEKEFHRTKNNTLQK